MFVKMLGVVNRRMNFIGLVTPAFTAAFLYFFWATTNKSFTHIATTNTLFTHIAMEFLNHLLPKPPQDIFDTFARPRSLFVLRFLNVKC